jgi:hypothetical protein
LRAAWSSRKASCQAFNLQCQLGDNGQRYIFDRDAKSKTKQYQVFVPLSDARSRGDKTERNEGLARRKPICPAPANLR